MDILIFGQIRDVLGCPVLQVQQVIDTDTLVKQLLEQYPALATLPYRVAVNGKMINGNVPLLPGAEVALLPPFSGG